MFYVRNHTTMLKFIVLDRNIDIIFICVSKSLKTNKKVQLKYNEYKNYQ